MASRTRKGLKRAGQEGEAPSPALRKRLAQIAVCERSGESLKSYAERHDLSPHTLYAAKRHGRRLGLLPPHRGERSDSPPIPSDRPARRFVEAVTGGSGSDARSSWRLRFPNGAVLEVNERLAVEDALTLIERLRADR